VVKVDALSDANTIPSFIFTDTITVTRLTSSSCMMVC
jgi:hypothetical protein